MSRWIKLTSIAGLVACSYLTVLMVFTGIAAACSGGGGGGGGGGCAAPSVSTGSATSISSNSVTLNGSVNPKGCATTYTFEYGRTSESGYPDSITGSAGSGTSSISVFTSSAIVQPSTSYRFRLSATNSGGTTIGGSNSFTTTAACTKPTVITNEANPITGTSATLNGTVIPQGCETIYNIEWGPSSSPSTYPNSTSGSAGNGMFGTPVSYSASGLQPNTGYHFRVSATNSKGTTYGSDKTFTTAASDPILFVHGWKGDATTFANMLERFHADGWPYSRLHNFAYDSSLSNVTTAQNVASRVNQLIQWTGASKVDIVTHSMGGLSSRYYIKNLGGSSKVEDWVSLGGPNHGTAMGGAIWCTYPVSCGEMKNDPMSSFLTALNSGDETPGAVRYMTIRSECDPIINPDSSVSLSGASNVPWNPSIFSCLDSHSLLHEDSWVYGQVKQFVMN